MYAAEEGHLHVLKHLQENGCPWDERTCLEAAQGGHLDVLKWLRKKGCPWDKEECSDAARAEHFFNLAEWINRSI